MVHILLWSALFLMFQSAFAQVYDCEQSSLGEVILYENGQEQPNSQGVVLVCVQVADNGMIKPAAICYDGESTFNEGAAAATCRQAGYATALEYNSSSQFNFYNPPNLEYFIHKTQCPTVKNYTTNGETALLRCSHTSPVYSTNISAVCPSSQLAAVVCKGVSISSPGIAYNGQVSLNSIPNLPEKFFTYIYLDGKNLPICIDDNPTSFATTADSVCRQLGLTQAFNPYPDYTIPESWYLGSSQCGSISYPCFTDCFDTSNYTKLSKCGTGKTGLGMQCIFNESQSGVYGSGSRGLCEIEDTHPSASFERFLGAVYAILAEIGFIISIIIVMVIIVLCKKKRNNYEALNENQEQA